MMYYLILDSSGYVVGTEESSGDPSSQNNLQVPAAVYNEVKNNQTSRVYRVNCGDIECIPVEHEIEALRRNAVNSLVSRMVDELELGIIRVTDTGTYRFKHDDETVAQLTLFSDPSSDAQTRCVKALNINTQYYDPVEMSTMEIASLKSDLADRWSELNRRYLGALNAVKAADTSVDIIRICRKLEVKVL